MWICPFIEVVSVTIAAYENTEFFFGFADF